MICIHLLLYILVVCCTNCQYTVIIYEPFIFNNITNTGYNELVKYFEESNLRLMRQQIQNDSFFYFINIFLKHLNDSKPDIIIGPLLQLKYINPIKRFLEDENIVMIPLDAKGEISNDDIFSPCSTSRNKLKNILSLCDDICKKGNVALNFFRLINRKRFCLISDLTITSRIISYEIQYLLAINKMNMQTMDSSCSGYFHNINFLKNIDFFKSKPRAMILIISDINRLIDTLTEFRNNDGFDNDNFTILIIDQPQLNLLANSHKLVSFKNINFLLTEDLRKCQQNYFFNLLKILRLNHLIVGRLDLFIEAVQTFKNYYNVYKPLNNNSLQHILRLSAAPLNKLETISIPNNNNNNSFSIEDNVALLAKKTASYFLSVFIIVCLIITIFLVIVSFSKVKLIKWSELKVLNMDSNLKDTSLSKQFIALMDENSTFGDFQHSLLGAYDIDGNMKWCIAIYKKDTYVFVKVLNKRHEHTKFNMEDLKIDIKQRSIKHPNIVNFIGVCLNVNRSIIYELCARGNLSDFLRKSKFKISNKLEFSLINDIISGILFVQNNFEYHGRLKAENCLITSEIVLKLTDFGFKRTVFKTIDWPEDKEPEKYYYCAPELVRNPTDFSPMADVYSFGVILNEIISRNKPFSSFHEQRSDILAGLKEAKKNCMVRPKLDINLPIPIYKLIVDCWNEERHLRPNFFQIKQVISKYMNDNNIDLTFMDDLFDQLEKYVSILETEIEQRNRSLFKEKSRTEELLTNILPKNIANALINNQKPEPEFYESASFYFSDVVGFTTLCSKSLPKEVIVFLNDLYTCFDTVLKAHDVYKVETIGDAYMIASGLPIRKRTHAREIGITAGHLLSETRKFKIRHRPDQTLEIRIGLHSGPCVAGVVGKKMPRYCCFGHTISLTSLLESTGKPMKIHATSQFRSYLRNEDLKLFNFELRTGPDVVKINKRGLLQSYFVTLIDENIFK